MQYLLEDIRTVVQLEGTLKDPFRRATFQVWCLSQVFHSIGSSSKTSFSPYWRKTAQVWRLQQTILFDIQSQDPPQTTLWTETICLWSLSCQIHTVCSSQTSQETSYQWETIHLSDLQQKVHFSLRFEDSLEDYPLSTQCSLRSLWHGSIEFVIRIRRIWW